MGSELSRQLWLVINDLRRAYRQAMAIAVQTDPHGTERTSAAWRTVAHRRAQWLEILTASLPFLQAPPIRAQRSPRRRTTASPNRPLPTPPSRRPAGARMQLVDDHRKNGLVVPPSPALDAPAAPSPSENEFPSLPSRPPSPHQNGDPANNTLEDTLPIHHRGSREARPFSTSHPSTRSSFIGPDRRVSRLRTREADLSDLLLRAPT